MPRGVYKKTEEHKRKLSLALRGKPKSIEHRRRISSTLRNNQEFRRLRKGVQTKIWQDSVYREHMIEVHRGLKPSDESIKKRSEAMKREYASGYVNPMKGKCNPFSEERK